MRLNRLCNLEDWQDPGLRAVMCRVLPHFARDVRNYPDGHEHRKHWEYAHLVAGLEHLGVIHPSSWILSVAAGHEEPFYELTNHVRWVFAVDLYGTSEFSSREARETILMNPSAFARVPHNSRRLVVQYMNALDLRFEDGLFDGVFCLSSIEHFGGFENARKALGEMERVLRPGGIAAITTECIVNQQPPFDDPFMLLFTPELLDELSRSVEGLETVEPIDYSVTPASLGTVASQEDADQLARQGLTQYPHVVMERDGRYFTSAAVFFRKKAR
ncbi:MAG TPA: class I SAM-dependent methyltransferase [Bryobacteraceae bacterium]|nr:class I SAM-dependent methyltransferase [Bryobacteraceae bacterium]